MMTPAVFSKVVKAKSVASVSLLTEEAARE